MRRVLALGLGVAAGMLAVTQLRPASLQELHIVAVRNSDSCYADLAWHYGPGVRPTSVIIDLKAKDAAGSATLGGEGLDTTIPLAGSIGGAYTLTATATYRLLGTVYITTRPFAGAL